MRDETRQRAQDPLTRTVLIAYRRILSVCLGCRRSRPAGLRPNGMPLLLLRQDPRRITVYVHRLRIVHAMLPRDVSGPWAGC